jgi:metal-responsive CopG/Arc/MetJ family transcriptional regulator
MVKELSQLIFVNVGFPKELYELMMQVVKEYGYATKQEFIREAVREYINGKVNTSVKRTAIYHGHVKPKLPHGDKL